MTPDITPENVEMTAKSDHHVNGDKNAPKIYALTVNGVEVDRATDTPVDLYWKARRAVNGNSDARAEVRTVSGFFVSYSFSDATLQPWERTV